MSTATAAPAPTTPVVSAVRTFRLVAFAVLAAVIATVFAGAVLLAFDRVEFPAYGNSNVLHALTVVGQAGALVMLVAGIVLARRGEALGAAGDRTAGSSTQASDTEPDETEDTEPGDEGLGPVAPDGRRAAWLVRLGKLLIAASTSALVAVTLAVPLSATRLYLYGISVDQEFRTQFLSRMTHSYGLPDMAYADLPTFYPAGWFWLGGRFAQLTGMPGWEAYKPWSVISLSVAAALVTVLWITLLRTDIAAVAAFASSAAMVAYVSHEPYSAVVALFAPPVMLLAWHALHPTARTLGRGATALTLVFLGVSASMYTLYTAVSALTVVVMAAVSVGLVWWSHRRGEAPPHGYVLPVVRLAVIGFGSIGVALVVWLPYLVANLTSHTASSGLAFHYLPSEGAQFPLPMFTASPMGALCLIGLVWIAARFPTSRKAQALGIGVVTIYLWCLASMALTAFGTTLLSFRTEALLVLLLSAAAVLGLAEVAIRGVEAAGKHRPAHEAADRRRRVTLALSVVAILLTIGYTQSIPNHLRDEIRVAYSDTDGYGERADRYPPGPQSHYREIADVIAEEVGAPATDTVVAATSDALFAYYPYLSYQAITSHYANPLGRYDERAEVIRSWAEAGDPEELHDLVTNTDWRAPDAIVARETSDGYALRPAADAYPNDPNVRRYEVVIPEEAVGGELFSQHTVGPFTVIIVH